MDSFDTSGTITKERKKIKIEIDDVNFRFQTNQDSADDVKAKIEGQDYQLSNFSINSISMNCKDNVVEKKTICSINKIVEEQFEKKNSKYCCFIPVSISQITSFHRQFDTVTYQDDQKEYFYDCLRIKIDNLSFDIIQKKSNGRGFYIIESLKRIRL